jgi:hypothetical protein
VADRCLGHFRRILPLYAPKSLVPDKAFQWMEMTFLILLLTFFSSSLMAHQSSLSPKGESLRWAHKNVPLSIKSNSRTLSPTSTQNIVQQSMSEWNAASSTKVLRLDGSSNQISFSQDFSQYGSAVIGLTEISYNSAGVISKASILLNEDNYVFSSNPAAGLGHIYLGDVVTHELGHFFGLSHSEVLNSSMFYSSYAGQSTLAADDRAGVKAKYDLSFGSISGYVKGGNKIGVLGVHVQAISRKSGETISAVSDENGYFSIKGLDLSDTYYLYTSPIKNPKSLPEYYSNVQDKFCPGAYVGSFFNACGKEFEGYPQALNLTVQKPHLNVGTVTINCSLKAPEEYNLQKIQGFYQPVTAFRYDSRDPRFESAVVGYFMKSEFDPDAPVVNDKFIIDLKDYPYSGGSNLYLKVNIISQNFGNPVKLTVDIRNNGFLQASYGRSVTVEGNYRIDVASDYFPLSTYQDSNHFELDVFAEKVNSTLELAKSFPSYNLFSSNQHWPYLVVASLWEDTPQGKQPVVDSRVNVSDNSACLEAPFTYSVARATTASGLSDNGSSADALPPSAGCGTIEPPSDGGSSSFPLLVLGFWLAWLTSLFAKRGKNFLS